MKAFQDNVLKPWWWSALKADHQWLWLKNVPLPAIFSAFPAKYGCACVCLMLQVDQPYKLLHKHIKPTFGLILFVWQLAWLTNQCAAHVLHHCSEKQVHCLVQMHVKNAELQQIFLPFHIWPCFASRHWLLQLTRTTTLKPETLTLGVTSEAVPLEMQGHHVWILCNSPHPKCS